MMGNPCVGVAGNPARKRAWGGGLGAWAGAASHATFSASPANEGMADGEILGLHARDGEILGLHARENGTCSAPRKSDGESVSVAGPGPACRCVKDVKVGPIGWRRGALWSTSASVVV